MPDVFAPKLFSLSRLWAPCSLQQANQSVKVIFGETREQLDHTASDHLIECLQSSQAIGSNPRDHHATVFLIAFPVDQPLSLHASQQSRNVRIVADQPLTHLGTRQSLLARSAQNSERVVLCFGDAMRLELDAQCVL